MIQYTSDFRDVIKTLGGKDFKLKSKNIEGEKSKKIRRDTGKYYKTETNKAVCFFFFAHPARAQSFQREHLNNCNEIPTKIRVQLILFRRISATGAWR